MGLLADIFSTADTAKRRLSGLLSDPLGTLALGVTRFGEDQGGLLNMTQNAYPMAGNKTVLNSPQQIANFRQQVADKGAEMAMQAATVWHGSPHKFDKFDSSKIGTGEGAQAYGHGIYTAQAKDVAQGYADSLRNNLEQLVEIGKKRGLSEPNAQNLAREYQKGTKFDPLIEQLQKTLESPHASDAVKASAKSVLDQQFPAYEAWNDWVRPGHLYKVDLPDDAIAKMLDWDKPLSQQHHVMELINKQEAARTQSVLDQRMQTLANVGENAPNASVLKRQIDLLREEVAKPQASGLGAMTGGEYYNYLRRRGVAPTVQADMFKQAGIPGIRYLDGGSRGAGAGSSNFVIFPGNEGLLQILERNGQALK